MCWSAHLQLYSALEREFQRPEFEEALARSQHELQQQRRQQQGGGSGNGGSIPPAVRHGSGNAASAPGAAAAGAAADGLEVLSQDWWELKENGELRVSEQTGDYVLVERDDVVKALAAFIAEYIVSLPEANSMEPRQLQKAVALTMAELRKGRVRRLLDWGKLLYRLGAVGYGAFSMCTNPWVAKAVLAALWSCLRLMGRFVLPLSLRSVGEQASRTHVRRPSPPRLPEHVAAAVREQLPSHTCRPAQLRAAVQHTSVTRHLLQHLQQTAQDGSSPAVEEWDLDAFKAAVREAARLGDLPLLDWLAASAQQLGTRAGQRMVARQLEEGEGRRQQYEQQLQYQQQQEKWAQELAQDSCRHYLHQAAHAALEAAAESGQFDMLRLACTAPASGQAASPAQQLLQHAVAHFAQQAAKRGQLAVLQLLLREAPPQLETVQLLRAAIRGNQLPAFQLVLAKRGMPADAGPALLEAVWKHQPAVLRRLVALGGLPADTLPLLRAATATGQAEVAEYLLQLAGLPAKAEQAMVRAIERYQPHLLAVMLTMSGPPADAHQLLMAAITSDQPAAAQQVVAAGGRPKQDGMKELLLVAIQCRQPATVQLLLEQGALPADTAPLLAAAISCDMPAVALELLVRGGVPPAAQQLLEAAIAKDQCAVVQQLLAGGTLAPGAAELCAAIRDRPTTSAGKLLPIMEALQAAGYRPTVYDNVLVQNHRDQPAQQVPRFDPVAEDPGLHLQTTNRFLWMALQRPEWSTETHSRFMPRFKRAVRALLLAAHRARLSNGASSGSGSGSGAADSGNSGAGGGSGNVLLRQLAALPNELLLHIVGEAAYPLSAWTPGA
ncbi:hypothetical protein C2E21_1782 [Chlorella sorokiniana]|uniref:Uncharacterized protein n=1 Tax=Chlorella sorokiniana TaxID=3076 RepID=A0A2P6U0W6_CHLSO|nr:hypothetical protein C2E21_1782 [Chlorella sorokiniana]|eukprot:PRW59956.1 hypothetical protein C2E21_1782 [Chlorella sorokiniana]